MYGNSRLLFYQEAPTDTAQYLYSSYAPPQRMARSGGISADSSTTITADTLTEPGSTTPRNPFSGFAAKDIMRFYAPGITGAGQSGMVATVRKVVTPTSPTSVVVDSLLTLSGQTAWDYQKVSRALGNSTDPVGTLVGWVDIHGWKRPTVLVQILTLPGTSGFGISIELRDPENLNPSIYYQRQFTAVGDFSQVVTVESGAPSLRVGILALDTDAVDQGSVTISVIDGGALNP